MRPRPACASAVVSPSVSVADTRKINVTEMMAPRSNSGVNGMMAGAANSLTFWNALKSTTPMGMATM